MIEGPFYQNSAKPVLEVIFMLLSYCSVFDENVSLDILTVTVFSHLLCLAVLTHLCIEKEEYKKYGIRLKNTVLYKN